MYEVNEVSIIFNGVRYDAVENPHSPICDECDLLDMCDDLDNRARFTCVKLCHQAIGNRHFKKSTKTFER